MQKVTHGLLEFFLGGNRCQTGQHKSEPHAEAGKSTVSSVRVTLLYCSTSAINVPTWFLENPANIEPFDASPGNLSSKTAFLQMAEMKFAVIQLPWCPFIWVSTAIWGGRRSSPGSRKTIPWRLYDHEQDDTQATDVKRASVNRKPMQKQSRLKIRQ